MVIRFKTPMISNVQGHTTRHGVIAQTCVAQPVYNICCEGRFADVLVQGYAAATDDPHWLSSSVLNALGGGRGRGENTLNENLHYGLLAQM
jgi:hypothetical protein